MAAKTRTIAGGSLYQVAAEEYGDATMWDRIAAASGLWDPIVTNVVTLVIPPADPGAATGGVLRSVVPPRV
jgi:hypothetical protein